MYVGMRFIVWRWWASLPRPRRHRARCRHQGQRLCLGEPPWQLKTANAMAAAPGRFAAPRGAALSSARVPGRTSLSAPGSAAAASGALHSSSTSNSVHASAPLGRLRGEMFRLHVLARAAFRTRTPVGGWGPRRCYPAWTSTTVPAGLYLSMLEPGYLQFSSSATRACATDAVANLKPWEVARRRT